MSSQSNQFPRLPGQVSRGEHPDRSNQPIEMTHHPGTQGEHEYEKSDRDVPIAGTNAYKPDLRPREA